MGYRKTFDPLAYEEFKPIVERLIKGGPGTKVTFTVSKRAAATGAQRLREFFKLNPAIIEPRRFAVRVIDHDKKLVEVEYKQYEGYGVSVVAMPE